MKEQHNWNDFANNKTQNSFRSTYFKTDMKWRLMQIIGNVLFCANVLVHAVFSVE